MFKHRNLSGLIVALGLLLCSVSSCLDIPCETGMTEPCNCQDGKESKRVCLPDIWLMGACDCPQDKKSSSSVLSGTYRSDLGKVIVFNTEHEYALYFSKENHEEKKTPGAEATYTVLNREIIFRDEEGNEIPERGVLQESETQFTWEKYPDDVFRKVIQLANNTKTP